MEGSQKIIEDFDSRNDSKLDVIFSKVIFEFFIEVSKKQYDIKPLSYVSLPGYTW